MNDIKELIDTMLKNFKSQHNIGLQEFKISKRGNLEIREKIVKNIINESSKKYNCIIDDISIIYDDDDFTRIFISFYDSNTLIEYIKTLEKQEKHPNIEIIKSALNKAITMLDDYNNMYGDQMPKTKEISDLDEVLKRF